MNTINDNDEKLIKEEKEKIIKEKEEEFPELLKDKIIINEKEDEDFIPHKKNFTPFNDDPYLDSNIFSRFFMYWAYKVLKISKSTKIKKEYLGKLNKKHDSKYFYDKFSNESIGAFIDAMLPLIVDSDEVRNMCDKSPMPSEFASAENRGNPIVRLGDRLFRQRELLEFHRAVVSPVTLKELLSK